MTLWHTPPLSGVQLRDNFLRPRQVMNHEATIPACLDYCKQTGRLDAFNLDWLPGKPNKPHIFWDSDVAKTIEGLALDMIVFPETANDPRRKKLDEIVTLVISAQQRDGYLNTYFTAVEPEKRWTCLCHDHELYNAGHLMEASVAHMAATGETRFVEAMERYSDHISSVFGREEGKKKGYPGHQEIELALVKLFSATGNHRHQELAKYFIDQRGQEPNYFVQESELNGRWAERWRYQADKPVREQKDAYGHAVRAMYLYSGMADVGLVTGDASLTEAAIRLWESTTQRNMYITGGVGSRAEGEIIACDYNLPNDTAYAESCAAMGLAWLSQRLLNQTQDSRFADVLERTLYNAIPAGIGVDGKSFFYSNMQEIDANTFEDGGNIMKARSPWFGCSCCPTNYARFWPQLALFALSVGVGTKEEDEVAIHFPAAMEASLPLYKGRFGFKVTGNYPFSERVEITITEAEGAPTLKVRIPLGCSTFSFRRNGVSVSSYNDRGYAVFNGPWRSGDTIEMTLHMPLRQIKSHPNLTTNAGRIALQKGPIVYALESIDNTERLSSLIIPRNPDFFLSPMSHFTSQDETVSTVKTSLSTSHLALAMPEVWKEVDQSDGALYYEASSKREKTRAIAIPYALWGNRGASSMRIWLREE